MAKRKAARATGRKAATQQRPARAGGGSSAGRPRTGATKAAVGNRKAAGKKAAKRTATKPKPAPAAARKAASQPAKKRSASTSARKTPGARKTAASTASSSRRGTPASTAKSASRSGGAAASRAVQKATPKKRQPAALKSPLRREARTTSNRSGSARSGSPRSAPRAASAGRGTKAPGLAEPEQKAASLDRERRVIEEEGDDIVATPPSSLDLDRGASAARSGRQTLKQRHEDHNETSPALTGGDVDADWESAYSVGDEAPGGDNPTPDQDVVDEIGKALGVEYEDNEELKGEKKISDRDRQRWELDPASSEDYKDRD